LLAESCKLFPLPLLLSLLLCLLCCMVPVVPLQQCHVAVLLV
jgi:hypothetical protein